ncbi:MAG: hypothetical protein ACRYGI_08060 [Janthinobacterium lividum]
MSDIRQHTNGVLHHCATDFAVTFRRLCRGSHIGISKRCHDHRAVALVSLAMDFLPTVVAARDDGRIGWIMNAQAPLFEQVAEAGIAASGSGRPREGHAKVSLRKSNETLRYQAQGNVCPISRKSRWLQAPATSGAGVFGVG